MVRLTMEEDLAALAQLVREKGVTELVVGLPLNLKGIDTAQTSSVRSFAEVLREHLRLPLAFWDERFTTTIALRQLRQAGYKPSRKKGLADRIAAVLILQSYLEARSRKSEDDGD
jgi:putative Holliday junction resolvase